MNDLVEGCKIEGEVRFDGADIYKDMDVNLFVKRWVWYFKNQIRFL